MVAMDSSTRSILQEERVAGFRKLADWPILADWIDGPRRHRQGHSGIAGPGGSERTGRERKESGKAENKGGRMANRAHAQFAGALGHFRSGSRSVPLLVLDGAASNERRNDLNSRLSGGICDLASVPMSRLKVPAAASARPLSVLWRSSGADSECLEDRSIHPVC